VHETFIIQTDVQANYLIADTNVTSLLTSELFSKTIPSSTSYNLIYEEGKTATNNMWIKDYDSFNNSQDLKRKIYEGLYNKIKNKFVSMFPKGGINNDIPAYDSTWTYQSAKSHHQGYFNAYYEPCCTYNEITYVWAKVSFVPYNGDDIALALLDENDSILGGTLRLGYVETWVDVNSDYLHEIYGFSVTTTISNETGIISEVSDIPYANLSPVTRDSDGNLPLIYDTEFGKLKILHEGQAWSVDNKYTMDDNGYTVLT
tara:strand:- start:48 stop:824 length:777 start_codon:yes stop_codon:yes gene_type:complete